MGLPNTQYHEQRPEPQMLDGKLTVGSYWDYLMIGQSEGRKNLGGQSWIQILGWKHMQAWVYGWTTESLQVSQVLPDSSP